MNIVKFILLVLQLGISIAIGISSVKNFNFTGFQGHVIIILMFMLFLLLDIFVNQMKE